MTDTKGDAGRHRRGPAGNTSATRTLLVLTPIAALAIVAGLLLLAGRPGGQPGRSDAARPTSAANNTLTATPRRSSDGRSASAGPSTAGSEPVGGDQSWPATGCSLPGRTLTVAAAPDIASTLRAVAAGLPAHPCSITVIDQDSATFAASWAAGTATRANVWIPNSSVWSARAARDRVPVAAQSPTIATSPIVLALTAPAAAQVKAATGNLSVATVIAAGAGSTIRIGVPDPNVSAESAGALLDLASSTPDETAAHAALTWAVRSSPDGLPTAGPALLSRMAATKGLAVPVSEHDLWTYNAADPPQPAVAAYPSSAVEQLDYPYVVLGTDPQVKATADLLLDALGRSPARHLLMANGFRDPSGNPGAAGGTEPTVAARLATPSLAAVDGIISDVGVVSKPSKILAVIDVSGSMAQQVPGGGGKTRLQYAQAAAARGLALYPSDSMIGLWTFSRDLTPTTDYRQIIPISPLVDPGGDGSGKQRLSQALSSLQVNPDGGTGLYDTTLAAVRQVRAQWDPHRFNSVIILSDGQNDDQGSIDLSQLVATLKSEETTDRPVQVTAIAFGPDSDVQAMTQISDATHGTTYVAQNPQDIGRIFLDAVGHRLCTSQC